MCCPRVASLLTVLVQSVYAGQWAVAESQLRYINSISKRSSLGKLVQRPGKHSKTWRFPADAITR